MVTSDEIRRRKRRRAAGALAFLMTVTGGWKSLPATAAGAYSVGSTAVARYRAQESEGTLQLIIGDSGFEPAQVMRGPGKFLFTADDRRGDKSQRLTLRLSREGGEQVRDIEVPVDVTDWAEELELAVGRYVLTEVNHPAWSCSLVIE